MSNETEFDALLDQALDEMALAPLPDDFMPRLLAQVEDEAVTAVAEPVAYQPEPFRLSLTDAIIPALLALLFAAFWTLSRIEGTPTVETVRGFLFSAGWVPLVLLIVVVELAMGAVLCFWLFGERPFPTITQSPQRPD